MNDASTSCLLIWHKTPNHCQWRASDILYWCSLWLAIEQGVIFITSTLTVTQDFGFQCVNWMSCDFSLHCWTKVNIIIGLVWCQEWELNFWLTYYKFSSYHWGIAMEVRRPLCYWLQPKDVPCLFLVCLKCCSILFLAISILIMIHFDFQKMSNTHMFNATCISRPKYFLINIFAPFG